MSLPRKVREQAEAANKLIEAQGNTDPAPATSGKQPAEPATTETPASQASEPLPKPAEKQDDFQPLDKPLGDENDPWEQKYRLLQGKYNAEVPRLQKQVKELLEKADSVDDGQIARLQGEILTLKQQLEQSQLAQPEPAAPSADLDKLREDYGDDIVNTFAQLNAKIDTLVAENTQLKSQVSRVSETTQRIQTTSKSDALSLMLAKQDIDFQQQNKDPLFMDWLQEIEPLSGQSRQTLLNDAYNSGDLERAAGFFTTFAKQNHSPEVNRNQPNLEQHVQVQPSAPPADTVPTEPVMWTQEQIKEFYRNKQEGKYTPEEAKRLENQLFAAMSRQ